MLTKQAIDKRFNDTGLFFIERILNNVLSRQISVSALPTGLPDCFGSVRILDSTEFKLPDSLADDFPGYGKGCAKACAAIQFEYDILNKTVHCLSLGSAKESDKTFADRHMHEVRKGDLLLRDLGYYSIDSYCKIEQQGAFYISRIKSQVNIYTGTGQGYKKLRHSDIVRKIKDAGNARFDQWVYIGEKQKHPVRLLASILPIEEQQKRLRHKAVKGRTIKAEDVAWSQLQIIISNVKADTMNAQQIIDLYKLRWQIELLFKVWKSIINIGSVRKMKTSRLKCYLLSKLIWILVCWDIASLAESILWKKERKLVSHYKASMIILVALPRLKYILFSERELLAKWLSSSISNILIYGWKEHKKGRLNLSKLLYLN